MSIKIASICQKAYNLPCRAPTLLPSLRRQSTQSQAEVSVAEQPKESVPMIDPLKHPDYFKVHELFTVKDMFDARVHYGHKDGSFNRRMLPYVYGSRLGHVIFDLDKTAVLLRQALNFTAHIAYRGGIILFINRNALNAYRVEQTARECGEYAHTRLWREGILTNSKCVFQAVTRLPDLCIFLTTLNDVLLPHPAVKDSAKMLIPSIAIVDSNCDPNLVTYPVPGNDDSPVAIKFYCNVFKEAILRGKKEREKVLSEGSSSSSSSS